MENKNTSVFMNALTWGIIVGLVSIVYGVILYMADAVFNEILGYLGVLILIGGLVLSVKSFRDNVLEGEISFGKAFGYGVVVSLVAGVLGAIYNYLLYVVIDPDLQIKMLDYTAEKMLEQGVPEGQIDQMLEISKRFMSPVITSIGQVVSTTLIGTIVSWLLLPSLKRNLNKSSNLS